MTFVNRVPNESNNNRVKIKKYSYTIDHTNSRHTETRHVSFTFCTLLHSRMIATTMITPTSWRKMDASRFVQRRRHSSQRRRPGDARRSAAVWLSINRPIPSARRASDASVDSEGQLPPESDVRLRCVSSTLTFPTACHWATSTLPFSPYLARDKIRTRLALRGRGE